MLPMQARLPQNGLTVQKQHPPDGRCRLRTVCRIFLNHFKQDLHCCIALTGAYLDDTGVTAVVV